MTTPATPVRTATPATPATPATTDGRQARGARSRASIVEAMLELIREGDQRPSTLQIAKRAGVTQRTLFNHFNDVPALMSEVAAAQVERVRSLLPPPPDVALPLEERAENFCRGLAALLEETAPVRSAANAFPARLEAVETGINEVRGLMRSATAETFAPELAQMTKVRRAAVLDQLEVLSDPAAWRVRRVFQGHSVAAASDQLARSCIWLLTGAGR